MKRTIFWLLICLCMVVSGGCGVSGSSLAQNPSTPGPMPTPKIDRQPLASSYNRGKLAALGAFDPSSGDPFQIDLRSYDLRDLDLSASAQQMAYASFDDQTQWPPAGRLPAGFDWKKMMENGRNPGLGVRGLHAQGITGQGVGIAIIDQPLQIDHPEYRDQLRLYEEINFGSDTPAQMHGPAVASIAVGKTVGVAPDADLYLIADWFVDPDQQVNFTFLAKGILRVLEINQGLPAGRKIRVISVSRGYQESDRGYADLMAAIKAADQQGIPVISVGMFGSKKVGTLGLGRDALADPDVLASYRPATFIQPYLDKVADRLDQLWIPIDSRTTASPTGTADYAYYSVGGMSWAEPYLAGVYALACQVDPKMTPDRFWKLATQTGQKIHVSSKGKTVEIGPVIDPPALIQAVKGG
jgi:subtilisin family serine protease